MRFNTLVSLVVLVATSIDLVAQTTVRIPDPVLEETIRWKLDKPDGEITQEELETITEIQADGVADFTGIDLAINLEDGRFHRTLTSDLSLLAKLVKLKELRVTGKYLSDLSPLSALVDLASLVIGGTGISDISPLSSLVKLRSLTLQNTRISDLTALQSLTQLDWLDLSYGIISDLEPLGLGDFSKLERLYLNDNDIQSLDGLKNLSNLEYLYLENNRISDLTPLVPLSNLRYLYIDSNRVSDLSPVGQMALDSLRASDNLISDLEPLSSKFVNNLDLSRNQIVDLTPIGDQFRLFGNLDVRYNYLDLSEESPQKAIIDYLSGTRGGAFGGIPPTWFPQNLDDPGFTDEALTSAIREAIGKPNGQISIHDLIDLKILEAPNAGIAEIAGLEHAHNLELLDLSKNWIVDAGPLALLQRLAYLDLSDNQIRTLKHRNESRSLGWLSEVEHLDLSNNFLSSNALLYPLTKLAYLDMSCNPIPFSEPRTFTHDLNRMRFASEANHAVVLYQSDCYKDGVLYHKILQPSGDQLLFCHDGYVIRYSGDLVNWRTYNTSAADAILIRDGIFTERTQVRLRSDFEGTHFFRAELD